MHLNIRLLTDYGANDHRAHNFMTETFDVVVIGAGPVGENVVERVIKAGLSAVVIESGLIDGECSCWA